ncbi:hypothetical protein K8W59_17035 [Nocardioides rotundus]|uniref:hypothetical protein n=1 Tax=Nocardioides rotundus TaxID=1774216 RepID=UPI001CBFF054|nr:hypothetical protein [Nocardioides rotundus]UAL29439.1 hypothetical protein K8W59_17035 [Nocardioides rotundus]
MFDNTCTACGKRQLIFPSQITGMTNHSRGITVTYVCWCGADQAWTTGLAARHRDLTAA